MGCSPSKPDGHTGFEYSSLGYQGMLIHNNKNEFRTTDERKVVTENVDNEELENKNNKINTDDKSGEMIIPPNSQTTPSSQPESAPTKDEKPSETQHETTSTSEEINSTNGQRPVSDYQRSVEKESKSPENKNIEKENEMKDNTSLKSEDIIVPPKREPTLIRPLSEPKTRKAEQNETSSSREEISSAHGRRPVSRYVRSVAKEPEGEPMEDNPASQPSEARTESESSVNKNETDMERIQNSGEESTTPEEAMINSTEGTENEERGNSTSSQNSSKIIPPVPEIIMSDKSPVSVSKEQPPPTVTPTAIPRGNSAQSQNKGKESDRGSRKSSIASHKEPGDTTKPLPKGGSADNGLEREWTTYRNDSFCSSASSVRRGSAVSNHGDGKSKTNSKPPSRESLLSCHSAKLIVPPSRESVMSGKKRSNTSSQSGRSSRRESKDVEKETMEESWILSGRQSATLKRELSDTGSMSSHSDQEQETDKDIRGNVSPEKEESASPSKNESQTAEEKMNGTEEQANSTLSSSENDVKDTSPKSSHGAEKQTIPSDKEMASLNNETVDSSRTGSASSSQNSSNKQVGSDGVPKTESPSETKTDSKSETGDIQRPVSSNENDTEETGTSVKDADQKERSSVKDADEQERSSVKDTEQQERPSVDESKSDSADCNSQPETVPSS